MWWLKQKLKKEDSVKCPKQKKIKMMHNNMVETKLCQKRGFEVPTYIAKPSNKWRESQSHWKEEKKWLHLTLSAFG